MTNGLTVHPDRSDVLRRFTTFFQELPYRGGVSLRKFEVKRGQFIDGEYIGADEFGKARSQFARPVVCAMMEKIDRCFGWEAAEGYVDPVQACARHDADVEIGRDRH